MKRPTLPTQTVAWCLLSWLAATPTVAPAQQLQSEEAQIQLVKSPPAFGTFYLIQSKNSPPYPFDPFFGELPVYEWKPGVYLVDDSKVDYVALRGERKLEMGQKNGEGMGLMAFGPPGLGGAGYAGMAYSYSSNELWLEIFQGTNNTPLILHNTTNGVRYQLLSRPEVARPPWLVEQTLFGAPGTNTPATVLFNERPNLFFWAGVDSDGDGLIDYLETLNGTNPQNPDTDNDGVNDYVEVIQGRDPLNGGPVADTTGLVNLQVYTPLR